MKNRVLIGSLSVVGLLAIVIGIIFQINFDTPKEEGKLANMNKVVCTYKSESSGVDIKEVYTLYHKDNKLKVYNKTIQYKYTKESEESALRYKGDWIKSQVQMSKNVDGIDISHVEKDYTITNSFDYDLEVFDSESYLSYADIYPTYNLDASVNTIVKEIESWEFTCKNK